MQVENSSSASSGRSGLVLGQGADGVEAERAISPVSSPEERALDPAIRLGSGHFSYDELAFRDPGGELGSPTGFEPTWDNWTRLSSAESNSATDVNPSRANWSYQGQVGGIGEAAASQSGFSQSPGSNQLSTIPNAGQDRDRSDLGNRHESFPIGSITAGTLGGVFPEMAPPLTQNGDGVLHPKLAVKSIFAASGPTSSGETSIDGCYGASNGLSVVGSLDGQGFGTVAIDPWNTRQSFPGSDDSLSVNAGNSGRDPFGFMSSFGSGRGQYRSSSDGADQGTALDLTKTNDLLQQLLDEVRKGRQPFLPMSDRNANF
jgi:hypothetical protein